MKGIDYANTKFKKNSIAEHTAGLKSPLAF